MDTDRRRLAAILGTLVLTLLVMPLQALYFSLLLYPLVVLAYLLPAGPARVTLLVGAVLTYVSPDPDVVAVVVSPFQAGIETTAVAAAETAFAFVMPPTLGMWLLVVACVLVQFDVGVGESAPTTG